ncbi:MAG: toprim domain-containing protein [Candidatus Altimarinota bacterium]
MKNEIDKFKKDISLVDFIENFGGVINRHKSTRNSYLMDFHDTKLVVKKNVNGHYIYFDFSNALNNGTIIDFYQKVVNKDATFKDAMIALRKFYKSGYIANEKLDISNEPDEAFDYARITKNIDENDLKNIELLRNISFQTLKEFEKVILKDTRENLCFPCLEYSFDENGRFKFNLSGFEIKNLKTNFKSQQGKKGLWGIRIGYSQDTYIFESAIDAMSFRELHQKEGFYISFGGSFSPTQIEYLKAVIVNSKSQNIYICLDNDEAGDKMSQDIISNLKSLNIKRVTSRKKDFNEDLKDTKKGVF